MKKFLTTFAVITTCTALFAGCAPKAPAVPPSTESIVSSEPAQKEPSKETLKETTSEELLPQGMIRSKLTNEYIDVSLYNQRPLAVMIPNETAAVPHYNLSQASIIYECNVEANMTRLLAIYEDYKSIDKLGNIRSLRDYYAYWAFEWDAILCHFGGPYYVDEVMAQPTTDSLNGNILSHPFFRSTDRDVPHNAYLNGTMVKAALEKQNIALIDRGLADEVHYQFASPAQPNTLTQYTSAENASFIDMSDSYPVTRCYFLYDESDGLYYRYQQLSGGIDEPHIDGATGEQLSFSNIIIESHSYHVRDQLGYLWYETISTGHDAWYITQGKLIKCTWEKTSDYGATRYYDQFGNEITLNTGKTMIMIIQDDDTFTYN